MLFEGHDLLRRPRVLETGGQAIGQSQPALNLAQDQQSSLRGQPNRSHVAAAPICGHHRGSRRSLTNCSEIRTHWKIVTIFDHPRCTWSWADVRGTAPQFCGPKFMDTGAMAVPIAGVRFGRSTIRRRGSAAAASRGPRPGASRAGWRLRQSHYRLQQAIAVLSSDSRPHHAF